MSEKTNKFDEEYIIKGIREADKLAFSVLFDTYYVSLVMFCGTYIKDIEECRDIVSSVFIHLWEKGEHIHIDKSLKAYLLNAVRNKALNHIRHCKVIDGYMQEIGSRGLLASHDVDNYILYHDTKNRLEHIVSTMPDKVREAYRFFMEEGMKTKDISLIQGVTQRTVELRLNKAFEILKKALSIIVMLYMMIK